MEGKSETKCPRCKGFVIIDSDLNGWYQQCLQCGYQRDIKDIKEIRDLAGSKNKTGTPGRG